jgi:quinol-cytochrome oxidoreductase complex cytochrome b subunit
MHYAADTGLASNSVEKIMRDVNSGWLLRYLHSNGASFFFIAAYIHIGRGLYYGSYKAPRALLWVLGCINFLLLMAITFMGYVLPWGQVSYWGANRYHQLLHRDPTGRRLDTAAARRLRRRQPDRMTSWSVRIWS